MNPTPLSLSLSELRPFKSFTSLPSPLSPLPLSLSHPIFSLEMMPPEHETSITNNPVSVLVNSRIEVTSTHAEPPSSLSNTSPCVDDQMSDQPPSTLAQFSVLRASLRPITLKVYKSILICNMTVTMDEKSRNT